MKTESAALLLSLVTLVTLVALAGCRRGPDAETLRREVQARLDKSFRAGLLQVRTLDRKGHYPYRDERDGSDRVLIYYDADLELRAAYRFSDWNAPNVGSLVSVLGATPHGVAGVSPAGNAKGDVLKVHGSAAFSREGDRWQLAVYRPRAARGKGRRAADELPPYRRKLEELKQLGAELQRSRPRGDEAYLDRLLSDVIAASRRRVARSKGWITLATGGPAGEYHHQGSELARILSEAGHGARAFASSGSAENLELLARREVALAYAQNDLARMAFEGSGRFAGQLPSSSLRALCSLYPEAIQIVTLASSGIIRAADLKGKRIGVGPPGSGIRPNALALLRAVGLEPTDFAAVQGADTRHAVKDLREGKIDAMFLTRAFPAPVIQELAEEVPVRIVGLSREEVDAAREQYPFFLALELPANTYPGMSEPRLTVQVTAMLLTHADVPAERVQVVLKHLFAGVKRLSRGSLQAYFISPQTALQGITIPLHPAARAYFDGAR